MANLQDLFSAIAKNDIDEVRKPWKLKGGEEGLLQHAISHNNIEVVKELLQYDAPLHTINDLFSAVANNDVDKVRELCEAGMPKDGGWSLLQHAISQNNIEVANVLLQYGAPLYIIDASQSGCAETIKRLFKKHKHVVTMKNKKGHMPLYEAITFGNVKIVQLIMQEYAEDESMCKEFNRSDMLLYEAITFGHVSIVQLILQEYAEDKSLWEKFIENRSELPKNWVMNMAIDNGQEQIVALLIDDCHWESFLLLEHYDVKEKKRYTPMRNLIKRMPHMASLVLDKCWKLDKHSDSIKAHYQLVDDMFCSWTHNKQNTLFTENFQDTESTDYSQHKPLLRNNHPLQTIARTNATVLMDNPVIKALLRRKWKKAFVFYFLFLVFYAIYLGLLTTLMFKSNPPFGQETCENTSSSGSSEVPAANKGLCVSVFVFAGIGIVLECIQAYLGWTRYIEFHNLLDWFTYVCPFIVFGAPSSCGELMHWQWQLGVACLFIAYINMLFYLRIVPMLGIYIMMVTLMLWNYLRLFLIMFLFLLSFAACFYLLLQNQVSFSTFQFSVMKSYTMMLGDVDFAGIFLDQLESDDADVSLHYVAMLWVLYVAFLVLMALVMMNLLTSLAVDGVQNLMEDSQHKIFALQITLALDVELALPIFLRKFFECVVPTQRFSLAATHKRYVPYLKKLNRCVLYLKKYSEFLFFGSLCKQDILDHAEAIVKTGRSSTNTKLLKKSIDKAIDKLDKAMDKLDKRVDNMDKKLDEITDLLKQDLLGGGRVDNMDIKRDDTGGLVVETRL